MGAHGCPSAQGVPPPADGPSPRIFVVYGSGGAEELLCRSEAEEILAAARSDPSATVVEEAPRHADSLLRHITIHRSRVPDTPVFPSSDLVALPDTLQGQSAEMLGASPSVSMNSALQSPGITEYCQFIAYPPLSEDDRAKFQGTLGQYRQWEAEELAKNRAVMKPPEKPKKGAGKKEKTET